MENLKLGLQDEKVHLQTFKNELRAEKVSLHSLISEPQLHLFVEERISSDKSRLHKQVANKHRQKLCHLLSKENRQIPNFLQRDCSHNDSTAKKSRKFVKRNKYRRKKVKIDKSLRNSLVTNYSDIPLSRDMQSLLNRGLNYSVTPKTVNTTNVIAGFDKLRRTMAWTEEFYKTDPDFVPDKTYVKKPWKPVSTNLPTNAAAPELNTFINGSLNCVLGSDLNKIHVNLPEREQRAMKQLISLQKDRKIVIKACDKTGGSAVMNTCDYVDSMNTILNATHKDPDGTEHKYFEQLDPNVASQMLFNDLDNLKSEVNNALNMQWIDKEQAKWLVPDEPKEGRLYGLVKDHVAKEKWPQNSKIPPLRPVESASGTTFENCSHFVDMHSNDIVKSLPSYWQDTPDMLRFFKSENDAGPQPPGTIPVTLDVQSLYTNIPIQQGIETFRYFLNQRQDKSVPTSFLIILLTFVLTCNILVFNNTFYLQTIGTAMGSRVAPTFACLFMAGVEQLALKRWKGLQPRHFRRYIDDIFFLWNGSENELLKFIKHLNDFHPYLKFTASYDFTKKTVVFLDTVISVTKDNFIKTDLYEKPGRKCNYLSPLSCHPSHITENIPYSLALRLKRICSENLDFLNKLDCLKIKLLSRGYKVNYITKAFDKVKIIDRNVALQKVAKQSEIKRPVLSLQYDPRLPSISNIIFRFWKVMVKNPRLKRIFPHPPMITWTRPKNLREYLIRAKLPVLNDRKSERKKIGFKHCNRNCNLCKHSPRFANYLTSSTTNEKFPILSSMNCLSSNVIYCITCVKQSGNCRLKPQYIGKTKNRICDRFNAHNSSIKPNSTKAVGIHFSSNGHQPNDFQMVPLEQVQSNDPWILLSREKYYIRKFDPVLNIRM